MDTIITPITPESPEIDEQVDTVPESSEEEQARQDINKLAFLKLQSIWQERADFDLPQGSRLLSHPADKLVYITTEDELKQEYELIRTKKSNLPRSIRDFVTQLYQSVIWDLIQEQSKQAEAAKAPDEEVSSE